MRCSTSIFSSHCCLLTSFRSTFQTANGRAPTAGEEQAWWNGLSSDQTGIKGDPFGNVKSFIGNITGNENAPPIVYYCASDEGIILLDMKGENRPVDIIGVCDVWDGGPTKPGQKNREGKPNEEGRGLYPSAERCKIKDDGKHVTKDFRKILELPDVDVIVVATPDHWHAKMCIDALKASGAI